VIVGTASPAAGHLAAYLASAEFGDGTVAPSARARTVVEEVIERSFSAAPSWRVISGADIRIETATSDTAPLVITVDDVASEQIAHLLAFRDLREGWDGESAAAPAAKAVRDALRFLRVAGPLAGRLEPTLHVDGSVILEANNGLSGALRFVGDGRLVFAAPGGHGELWFDGKSVPPEVKLAFDGA